MPKVKLKAKTPMSFNLGYIVQKGFHIFDSIHLRPNEESRELSKTEYESPEIQSAIRKGILEELTKKKPKPKKKPIKVNEIDSDLIKKIKTKKKESKKKETLNLEAN